MVTITCGMVGLSVGFIIGLVVGALCGVAAIYQIRIARQHSDENTRRAS